MNDNRKLENGLWYAELDGRNGSYELGRQSGAYFADVIIDNIAKMKKIYCEICTPEELEQILDHLENSRYLDDLRQYAPGLYDEMRGIADGCGATFKDIMMLNYLEEVPNAIGELHPAGCSAVSVTGRQGLPNMIFQNMDFTDAYEGFEAVYKIQLEDKSILMYGFVGQFGGIGVNSRGVGDTINVICNCPNNVGFGVPSTALLRLVLEQDSVEQAEALLRSVPVSTAGCYMVTDTNTTAVFEVSPSKVEKISAGPEGWLVHTNHAIATDDVVDVPGSFRGSEALIREDGFTDFKTVERYDLLCKQVGEKYATLTVDDAIGMLTAAPVNVQHGLMLGLDLSTLQSMVAVCDGENSCLYVAQGMESDRKYVKLSF